MPKLQIKKPCNDCPFRRNSLSGWLGNDSWVDQETTDEQCRHFLSGALADYAQNPDTGESTDLPCHKTIDYSDKDWQKTQYPDAPLCAGALIFARNNCKMPKDPERAANVQAVEPDPNVFRYPHEFVEHHGGSDEALTPMERYTKERMEEEAER